MTNPLVAERQDSTTAVSGIGIAESAVDIYNGVSNGSWVEGGLGLVGGGLETLSLVIDPVGTLVSYGVAWLMEHVKPLSDALDWLAGDGDTIASYAQTWRNVSQAIGQARTDFDSAVQNDTAAWTGAAGDAYRNQAAQQSEQMGAAATSADTVGTVVEVVGVLVGVVREVVRDLVADCVATLIARIPQWLAEIAGTLGIATPHVIASAVTLISRWVARISDVITTLVRSINNLRPLLRRLDEIWAAIRDGLRGLTPNGPNGPSTSGTTSTPGTSPVSDPGAVNSPTVPGGATSTPGSGPNTSPSTAAPTPTVNSGTPSSTPSSGPATTPSTAAPTPTVSPSSPSPGPSSAPTPTSAPAAPTPTVSSSPDVPTSTTAQSGAPSGVLDPPASQTGPSSSPGTSPGGGPGTTSPGVSPSGPTATAPSTSPGTTPGTTPGTGSTPGTSGPSGPSGPTDPSKPISADEFDNLPVDEQMQVAQSEVDDGAKTFADNAEAQQYGSDYWNDYADNLPPEQGQALFDYTSDPPHYPSYVEINGALRGTGPMTPEVQAAIDRIDEALAGRPVPENVVVTRGTGLGHIGMHPSDMVGRTFTEDAYISTSLGDAAGAFSGKDAVLHMQVPAGTPGIWVENVGAYGAGERELLLGRGLEYRVDRVVFEGGQWHVYGEYLPAK